MRACLLDKQTADKRKEYMLIKKAYDAVHPPKSIFQSVQLSEFQTETKSDGYLSAKKMAYIDSVGLCFTNAKGKVSKKVHSMHEMEYLIHQINDYIAKFFENTILPDNGVGIYTRLKFDTETGEEDPEQDTDKLLYRGDPFWTSSHGSNSDSANSEVNNPLKKN
jgi:hypothetical protein